MIASKDNDAFRGKLPAPARLIASSDAVIVGRVGIMTSTGGSINAEIEVEAVLKGPLTTKELKLIYSTLGASFSPELKPGEPYLLCLRALPKQEFPVYCLAEDQPSAAIRLDKQAFGQIQTLVRTKQAD